MSQDKAKLIELVKTIVKHCCDGAVWDYDYPHKEYMTTEWNDHTGKPAHWVDFLLETFGLSLEEFEFDEDGYFKD
jgi:hypothetical protein